MRDKTTKEREGERQAQRAREQLSKAKRVLADLRAQAQNLNLEGRLTRKIGQVIFDQIEWLIAEDETYAQAAAEMWAATGRQRDGEDLASSCAREQD